MDNFTQLSQELKRLNFRSYIQVNTNTLVIRRKEYLDSYENVAKLIARREYTKERKQ